MITSSLVTLLVSLGVPSGVAGFAVTFGKWCYEKFKKQKEDIDTLKLAIQSFLRDRLIQSFKEYHKQGYVDIDEREAWINMYNQYHSLGGNGVLDNIKEKFLSLPLDK